MVPWVDEIVVVDMYSSDGTRDIAERHGARVLLHEPMGFVEPARAWSVAQATGDWVLLLDADEVIPRRLSDRLLQVVASDEADVVDIPELNYFFGEPIMRGGWHPDAQRHPRFFRKGMLQFSAKVHAPHVVAPGARVLVLSYEPELAISHFAYTTISEFLERTERYTSLDIEPLPGSMRQQIRHASGEVAGRLFRARGLRDGSRGFVLAVLMGIYDWMLWFKRVERHQGTTRSIGPAVASQCVDCTIAALKVLERVRWRSPDVIRAGYVGEARRLLADYGIS